MQQQFGVFQLVLAQLLTRNNPGDPLINLLSPTQQPSVQQQDPQLETYDGMKDLDDHLHAFYSCMQAQNASYELMCKMFPSAFRGNAQTWYYSLPPRSISSYTEMTSTFATKFSSRRLIRKTTSELMRVKQRDRESLKNYMSRFNDVVLEVSSFNQAVGIATVIPGLQHERFRDSLIKHPATTFNEVNDRSLKFKTTEEYALSQKPVLPKNQNPDWRNEGLDPALLQKYDGPIYGFNNQHVQVERALTLNVAFGSGRTYVTPSVQFLVVKMASFFNAVIGRPTLTKIRVVVSQSHLCMKFPTPIGITTLRAQAQHQSIEETSSPEVTSLWGERLQVIKEEVEKLLQAGFVRRVDYCEWVANLVLVKKANGKWRMCIDYTNLNQACPKDCYPMPSIDKLVEVAYGNERLSLLDAYSGYHQCQWLRRMRRKPRLMQIMRSVVQKDESGKQKKFEWNRECEAVFNELKSYLSSPPLLTKAIDGEILYLYLELRYPIAEKAALAVVTSARKLRPYFQSHPIIVFTDQPLREILQKPECSGRLIKWAVERGEFEITFQQSKDSRAGAFIVGPNGYRSEHALKFNFDATSNMAEYEALLLSLQLALEWKVMAIRVYNDSQLVVNQVNSVCEVVDLVMMKYVALVAELKYELSFMKPRMMEISTDPTMSSWIDPIVSFLRDKSVPEDKQEEMRLRKKASQYTLVDGVLYKRSFSLPLLRCLNPYEAEYALWEVHEGVCGSHIGARTLAHKVLRQGYYWPNIYGIPNQIVAYNGTQFNYSSFKDFYFSYGIKLQFTSIYHLESNGETPYHLAFGSEAVIPIEIGVPSFWVTHFDEGRNGQLLRENLDLLTEVREEARLRTLVYKQKLANFYNKRVDP
ncbi:hypothetical protein SLEP1_g27733 [Rubroshorea leprosula]|uniref:RNase H type-1 domain-containing protein n=1 Tax=Rubroshorea leprosula TaxID=152421 RepID=A0AAV5K0M7_9ROSI|nr:hypothetical protein SLEP1_g27733 [Rubroshorea leprosula]